MKLTNTQNTACEFVYWLINWSSVCPFIEGKVQEDRDFSLVYNKQSVYILIEYMNEWMKHMMNKSEFRSSYCPLDTNNSYFPELSLDLSLPAT